MIDERQLDIMEVEAEVMVMQAWLKFEREFLGDRYIEPPQIAEEPVRPEQPELERRV